MTRGYFSAMHAISQIWRKLDRALQFAARAEARKKALLALVIPSFIALLAALAACIRNLVRIAASLRERRTPNLLSSRKRSSHRYSSSRPQSGGEPPDAFVGRALTLDGGRPRGGLALYEIGVCRAMV